MPATPRGVPYPSEDDLFDVPGDLQGIAEWIDVNSPTLQGVADLLGAHAVDSTGVHGIPDTSALEVRAEGRAYTDQVATATRTQVLAELRDGAPIAFDTLMEISARLDAADTADQAALNVILASLDGKATAAALDTHRASSDHDGRYYTKTAADLILGAKASTAAVNAHTADSSNPHAVTKAQVGLGSVDNVSAAALRERGDHTGTQGLDTTTDSAAAGGRLAMTDAERAKLGTLTPLTQQDPSVPGATGYLSHVTITDDGTDTATWPNRLSYQFAGHLTGWFNEYGELRVTPGKPSTIPFRAFTKDQSTDTDHNAGVAILEVVLSRNLRTQLWRVDNDGSMWTAGTLKSQGAITREVPGGPTLSAGHLVLAAGAAVPAGTPAGTLIYRTA